MTETADLQRSVVVIAVDHANGYRSAHAEVLSDPALMRGLGLADADGLTYRLERDGVTSEVTIAEMAGSAVRVVRAADDAPITSLSGRYAGPNWYTRTGADGATVYLKYSDCVAEAKDLFAKLIAELEHSPAERLIIDIRSNSGGTSVPGRRLSRELAGIPSLQTSGSIFVLISPRTFSSGMMLAVDPMERTPALFAGQAFAQRPDSWGEVERFPLPNSGLMIGHSTRFFTYSEGKELRLDADGMIAPDPGLAIERTFEEYARGIDQVLEAVLVLTSSGRG